MLQVVAVTYARWRRGVELTQGWVRVVHSCYQNRIEIRLMFNQPMISLSLLFQELQHESELPKIYSSMAVLEIMFNKNYLTNANEGSTSRTSVGRALTSGVAAAPPSRIRRSKMDSDERCPERSMLNKTNIKSDQTSQTKLSLILLTFSNVTNNKLVNINWANSWCCATALDQLNFDSERMARWFFVSKYNNYSIHNRLINEIRKRIWRH